jgi:hypothetical protein
MSVWIKLGVEGHADLAPWCNSWFHVERISADLTAPSPYPRCPGLWRPSARIGLRPQPRPRSGLQSSVVGMARRVVPQAGL